MHQRTDTDNQKLQKSPAGLLIRQAATADCSCLVQFNCSMAWETEQFELDEETVMHGVSQMIAHPELGFYLLAEIDTQIAGSLMLTSEWSDWRNGLFWWIQSVYVRPRYRHQGIYRALYLEVKRLAAQRGDICGFRLYVEQENTLAQACYRQLGMEATHYLLYEEAASK